MKACKLCAEVLPLAAFFKNAKGKLGRMARCKACIRRVYYEPNKARALERTRSRRKSDATLAELEAVVAYMRATLPP